jgi:2-keto-4-pentenoate hydratase
MMADPVAEAATLLLAARNDSAKLLDDLPAALKPADRAAAYRIQHAVAKSLGAIGGWKVSPFGQGTPPMCGPLPASGIVASPGRLTGAKHRLRGIEAEVSVRMGRDLAPRATPYSREEVAEAIASMHPSIELIESRFIEPNGLDINTAIADAQGHGGFVYGPGTTAWRGVDLTKESAEQLVDGVLNASRTGHPAGDLLAQVVWMANEGAAWAGGLKAGQFVTCGSWSGANRVGPTAKVRVRFSTLGEAAADYVP